MVILSIESSVAIADAKLRNAMKERRGAAEGRDVEVFEVEIGGESLVVISMPGSPLDLTAAGLTAAEQEVTQDVLSGLSTAAIASKRGRSPNTVANQLASIYAKLGVVSRAELTAFLLAARPPE
jgi:DNA-binding CsgD family transcriptional regulator